MDVNDTHKANEIINYYTSKLQLNGRYELKLEPRLNGCAKADSSYLKFDIEYYKALKDEEFRATVVHELGHCTRKARIYDNLFIFLFLVVGVVVWLIISTTISVLLILLVPIIYLIARRLAIEEEFVCDKIAKENRDYYEIQDLISAIKKAECKYDNSLIEKCIRIPKFLFPHPSYEKRKRKLLMKPKPHVVPW